MYRLHTIPLFYLAEPPKITNQPKRLRKVVPGTNISFTVQATGTDPLSYQWEWKPAEEEDGSGEWQLCPAEWSDGPKLTIPNVQRSNEGWYHCVISNFADSMISKPVKLSIGKNKISIQLVADTVR